VRKIAGATEAEIAELPGIGRRLASAVLAALAPGPENGQRNGDSQRGAS
jgi:adenine-specific DNA glycosylase